ncbi:MAG: hypothetical protein AAB345_04665 [Patescibacteria group bacterium]
MRNWSDYLIFGVLLAFGLLVQTIFPNGIVGRGPLVLGQTKIEISKDITPEFISKYDPDLFVPDFNLTPYYPKGSRFRDLKWRTAHIVEKNKYADINLQFPEFIGGPEIIGLNAYIKGIAMNRLSSARSSVDSWIADKESIGFKEYCGPGAEAADGETLYGCSVQLKSRYNIPAIVNDIVSIEIVLTDYTGGGNGNHDSPITINYDLKTNRPLGGGDLFCKEDELSLLAKLSGALITYSATNSFNWRNVFADVINWEEDPQEDKRWIMGIVGRVAQDISFSDTNDVLLSHDRLTLVYPPYKLSGGVFGTARIPIPYSLLGGVICLP